MPCMLSDKHWVTAMEQSLHGGHITVNICKKHGMAVMGLHHAYVRAAMYADVAVPHRSKTCCGVRAYAHSNGRYSRYA